MSLHIFAGGGRKTKNGPRIGTGEGEAPSPPSKAWWGQRAREETTGRDRTAESGRKKAEDTGSLAGRKTITGKPDEGLGEGKPRGEGQGGNPQDARRGTIQAGG